MKAALPIALASSIAVTLVTLIAGAALIPFLFESVADTNYVLTNPTQRNIERACGLDSSTNGYDLTPIGDPTVASDTFAPFGGGVEVDRVDDSFLREPFEMAWQDGFAVSAAFDWQPNPSADSSTEYRIAGIRDATFGSLWLLRMQDTDADGLATISATLKNAANGNQVATSADTIAPGKHGVSLFFDGANARIYLDGAEVASLVSASEHVDTGGQLRLFANIVSGQNVAEFYRAGYDLRIWDSPPAEATIQAQSNPTTASGAALGGEMAWYPFDCSSATITGSAVADGLASAFAIALGLTAIVAVAILVTVAVPGGKP